MILIGPYPEKSSRIQLNTTENAVSVVQYAGSYVRYRKKEIKKSKNCIQFFKKGSGEKKLSVYAQNSYDCVLFFTGRCSYTCKVISVEGKMNIQMREVCF